jgi:AraC family transcriptional regulator, regulatory protein of adaptative response / methylphosphotriester-DNA alkyltransferase methyltransferase
MVRSATKARRRELFEEAAEIIASEFSDPLTIEGVAGRLFVSRRQLQRAFAESGSATFRSYLCRVRMERAAALLGQGSTVREAAHAVGYRQPAQFAKAFRRHHRCTPATLRRHGTEAGQPHDVRQGLRHPSSRAAAARPYSPPS